MDVAVLVLDGVFDTGLTSVLDTLETANVLASSARRSGAPFRVRTVGVRRRARTHHGLDVPLAEERGAPPDVVIVPGLGATSPESVTATLVRRDVRDAAALLRAWHGEGARLAGACTATFLLAEAGLLDGLRATTTWWLAPAFRARFPSVDLDESRMIVDASRVVTAGAALAHLDLALWLVRRSSPTLARATARHLVFDARPSQAAYVMPDHLAHADALVEKFERWTRRHLAAFSLPAAARAVGASERTLERRIRRVLGKSPLSFVQDLRVEQAVHALETSEATIDEIAERVGYRDGVTLRTLLRKKTGRGVRELRGARGR
jgi:transcriptional regulator GlxA family with amidase domain